jgi:hypothetical protein
MKRILPIIVLTFLFALLVFFTILVPTNYNEFDLLENKLEVLDQQKSAQTIPSLTFCELVRNPEKYDGETVRLNAKLSIGLEGSWFSDLKCGVDNAAVISSENKEVWEKIRQAREQKDSKFWSNTVDLIVIGRFKNIEYKDCCLIAPFQFEILKIEKALSAN